jgi:hypothetical protein
MKYIFPILILFLTSCGKTITFEKIIVNNTDETITVSDKEYTSLHEPRVIAPRTTETLVLCGWQSYSRPSRDDVENRFQITSDKTIIKRIEQGKNWSLVDEKDKVTCTFVLNQEDVLE